MAVPVSQLQSINPGAIIELFTLTLDSTLFNASKLFVEVSIGSTKALHQLMAIYDGTDVYTQQSPFLSISDIDILDTAAGIGTFGGEFNGSDAVINFYPDSEWTAYAKSL